MASPSLSRSPSATFAPTSRRSHPNLHHLSLAPLTPKYPIDPADYDAYFDPSTSELHTSTSLSQISALPSPGGILTNSPARSRATSRTRSRRKVKSTVSIQEPESTAFHTNHDAPSSTTPSGAISSAGFGHRPTSKPPSRSSSRLRLKTSSMDSNWLIQTGLHLTESNREFKGQSWITKRESSTSLANTPTTTTSHLPLHHTNSDFSDQTVSGQQRFFTPRASNRATPVAGRSRNASRNGSRSRRASWRNLTMTSGNAGITEDGKVMRLSIEEEDRVPEENEQADWADARTQAEVVAHVQRELEEQFGSNYSLNSARWEDPYGMLDFDGHFDDGDTSDEDSEGDEEEVRRAMSRFGIRLGMGNWFDDAVDVLARLEDEEQLEGRTSLEAPRNIQHDGELLRLNTDDSVEAPPARPRGVWDDVAWFGRLIARTVQS